MGKKVPLRLHQEDFAQALGITASQKYEKNGKDYLDVYKRQVHGQQTGLMMAFSVMDGISSESVLQLMRK